MKIDMYAHICPKKFMDAFSKRVTVWGKITRADREVLGTFSTRRGVKGAEQRSAPLPFWADQGTAQPMLWDIDSRLEIMDKYEDYVQVLVPVAPPVGTFCSPEDAAYLASIFNDELAELTSKYPDKFVAAVAYLPLNNIDATLKEIDRTINELGFKGIYLYTPIHELKKTGEQGYDYDYETMKPLDSPEFMPIYESMSRHKLPIWIHPWGEDGLPVYRGEERAKYALSHVIGWPLESAMAMSRLVCSGILAKYPNLRFIIHHCGSGIIPALAGRLEHSFDPFKMEGMKWGQPGEADPFQIKPPIDYFRMFYADTALYGDVPGLMCGHAFFGVQHILFGTDYPFDIEGGDKYIRLTIDAVHRMNISDADKEMIFEGNAKRILRLEI